MTDRELLEKAAKAAGLAVIIPAAHQRGLWIEGLEDEWNPLTDDGDALRLAVKLDMEIYQACDEGMATYASYRRGKDPRLMFVIEYHDDINNMGDRYAATRRAIVRAAAEIGEHMEKNNGN